MSARSLIIPGAIPAVSGGASLKLSTLDQQIANLPGLIHVLDPASLTARNVMARDRRSGAPMYWGTPGITKEASGGAAWGNQPVLAFADGANHVRMQPDTMPASYTVMFVASHTAVLNAAGARTIKFFTTYGTDTNATGEDAIYQWIKPNAGDDVGMGIEFYSTFSGLTSNKNGPISNFNIGNNVPRIWCVSFDAETLTSRIYNQSSVNVPLSVKSDHVLAGKANAGDFFTFGGSPYQENGLIGNLGMCLVFDRDMAKPENNAGVFLAQARSLLAQKYSIA